MKSSQMMGLLYTLISKTPNRPYGVLSTTLYNPIYMYDTPASAVTVDPSPFDTEVFNSPAQDDPVSYVSLSLEKSLIGPIEINITEEPVSTVSLDLVRTDITIVDIPVTDTPNSTVSIDLILATPKTTYTQDGPISTASLGIELL